MKTTVPAVEREEKLKFTQELKAGAGQRYAQKVPDKLHPLPRSVKPKPHLLPLKKARPAILRI